MQVCERFQRDPPVQVGGWFGALVPGAVVPPVALCKEWGSVPPDDLPLVTIKTTPKLDQRDFVVAYIIRQCGEDVIHAWLMRRIASYAKQFGQTWSEDLPTYAAARDAACWQLNRTEAALWLLLEGIEACLTDFHYHEPHPKTEPLC